jgi:putative nucleotidyltransferase with HDIG domain
VRGWAALGVSHPSGALPPIVLRLARTTPRSITGRRLTQLRVRSCRYRSVRQKQTASWAGRPRVALLVRLAYVVIPLVGSVLASALLVRVRALTDVTVVVRWLVVLAASTLVLVVTHRLLVRLLPLAALLELSIEFPGPAPSRYAVARDAGNLTKLKEIVAGAQRGDRLVDLKDAEAARDILALVAALGSHDAQTRGHSERVRVFTDLIADQLRITGPDRSRLRWAALLHDVGKLGVPSEVLGKTEKLNESDWTFLRGHPSAGAQIARPLNDWLGPWNATIAQHHEKYDGTGYPHGLAGEQICLGARIVAVADAFDVMTAARSYRKPIGRVAALRELADCSGSHFDPRVVRAMLAVSTPRLRVAMGPISWLGAAPFLAASQGAAAVAAQATASVLVAGTVVVAGPTAWASPSPVPGPPGTGTRAPQETQRAAGTAASPALDTTRTAAPTTSAFQTSKPTAPPGKPTTTLTTKGNGKPTAKPTVKGKGKPIAKPTVKGKGKPIAKPTVKGNGKPTSARSKA